MPSTTERRAWARPAARWTGPKHSEAAALLSRELGIGLLAAAVLANRGYLETGAAREFLHPEVNRLHDPWLMRGMEAAVLRIQSAIQGGEPILLYGDYDVDGTCSIVVLKAILDILGARTEFFIPHRVQDGYGMRSEVIDRAACEGIRLIISVDTGIRASAVVRHAAEAGIDVIVTDHHIPDGEVPPAIAVLNPHLPGCQYPNPDLCGAGVTFKLVEALLRRSGMPEARQEALLESLLKPVAIATVADVVPLTGENRIIVKRGLSGLRRVRNAGLRSLLRVAGFEDGDVPSAHQVAFRLAPRINAAGRMATARDVIELFLTKDQARADALAADLDDFNRERQQVEAAIVDAVLEECAPIEMGERCGLVFCGAEWHVGVLGIVASRLVERFGRPVFVLSEGKTTDGSGRPCLTGSGRSIPSFHLLEALESMPELFVRFGGHRQAAGITLRAEGLEEFRSRFDRIASARLTAEDLCPEYQVDACARLSEFADRSVYEVLDLGPFGFGNPVPVFCCRGVQLAGSPRPIGEGGKHYKLLLRQDNRTLMAKAWNMADRVNLLEDGARLDVLLQIEDDPFSKKQGYAGWCLSLKDVKPSV